MKNHLDEIDNNIEAKHLLKHPFYLAWTRGELSNEALADYARQYYHHVRAFPTYLSAVHAKCENEATRKQLLNNLIDEEAGSPNHPELWLHFADGLGIAQDNAKNAEKWPETKKLIETFRSVCGDGKHYGFNKPEHYQYFSVHIEADREHSAAERRMLDAYLNEQNFESVKRSVNRVLDALWEMLSGVCRRHAIAC